MSAAPRKRIAKTYEPQELSWLSFNERVLQEASDPSVPLIQRVRYLGIFSNNMDEFFRVRVADVRRLATFSSANKQERFKKLLSQIQARVFAQQDRFDSVYLEVLKALRKKRIYLVNEKQLDDEQTDFVRRYFFSTIQPELEPVLLDDHHPLPELSDSSIYLAIKLSSDSHTRVALLEIPSERLGRFIQIPQRKGHRGKVFMVVENMIRVCLPDVFRGVFPIQAAEAYTIKLTRDAELELDEGITQTLIDKVSSSLKKRRKADPVRFLYDQSMPEDLQQFLNKRFNLGRYDSLIPGGRYHNSKDFMQFPNVGRKSLEFRPLPALAIPALECDSNVLHCVRNGDALLYFPYHSFGTITNMLQAAAIDPAVRSIKISLYRVASHSHIIDALLNAVRNHKQVTAVVELQARFDEQANIDWAKRLTEGGVHVIFGVPGLKVHSKLILITRQEGSVQRYYSYVGTGNFNENTSRFYTDLGLLTFNQELGADIANVFDFIQYTYRRHRFRHLFVSPHTNRSNLMALINAEIEAAQEGEPAEIVFKCNNLVDQRIINKLYEASQAGVRIRLIVRGMCGLVAGVAGLSENIRAISIVDRYLEHPRLYVFRNRGKPLYYISSADLMTRNLDYRIEVTCPVYDPALQETLRTIIELQWQDNTKARVLNVEQDNQQRHHAGRSGPRIRSQEAIHRYLEDGYLPARVRNALQKSSLSTSPRKPTARKARR